MNFLDSFVALTEIFCAACVGIGSCLDWGPLTPPARWARADAGTWHTWLHMTPMTCRYSATSFHMIPVQGTLSGLTSQHSAMVSSADFTFTPVKPSLKGVFSTCLAYLSHDAWILLVYSNSVTSYCWAVSQMLHVTTWHATQGQLCCHENFPLRILAPCSNCSIYPVYVSNI